MRVLVVEDEPHVADAITRGLVAEGMVVITCGDGRDGLHRALNDRYDVIVLDILLPTLSGYEVCRQLRAAGDWTPVLVLTAKDGEYDEADALDLGADGYLTKPFSFVVLLAHLRALVRRGAPPRPTLLTVDDLVLDPAAHRCHRGSAALALTPREVALLEHLMRHTDTVVSREDIVAAVWDDFYEGDRNIVDVYIGHLRRKIDTPFGRSAIQTVRGVGYRLDGRGARGS